MLHPILNGNITLVARVGNGGGGARFFHLVYGGFSISAKDPIKSREDAELDCKGYFLVMCLG